jgi:ADP-ribosylation factor-like protein 6
MFNKIATALGAKKREATILVIGLDYSGKSTILNRLKPQETRSTDVPTTVGFATEKFQTKSFSFVAIDMSGQGIYVMEI